MSLTKRERELNEALGEVAVKFSALPAQHPSDLTDFVFHTHALQNIILQRPGHREVCNSGRGK